MYYAFSIFHYFVLTVCSLPHQIVFNRKIIEAAAEEANYK